MVMSLYEESVSEPVVVSAVPAPVALIALATVMLPPLGPDCASPPVVMVTLVPAFSAVLIVLVLMTEVA